MSDAGQPTVVELVEWERVGPTQNARLRYLQLDPGAAGQAEALRDKVDIRPAFGGLEIEATSYVGQVDLGPLRIVIRPKLPDLQLTRLLRYAYRLRDLGPPLPGQAPVARHGLQDILVGLLAVEADELLHRGLARQYVARDEKLDSPRGRILVGELARRGGVLEARLMCRHHDRQADWQLNRVLRSGLLLAASLATDGDLRRRMHRLDSRFEGVTHVRLDRRSLSDAVRDLTRLTVAYAPALTLIELLMDAHGLTFEEGNTLATPGFLFDMNSFFQRLVSRFLQEHLPAGQRIEDEQSVRGLLAYAAGSNPRNRRAPLVRPDYALTEGGGPARFLDAKYRDIWENGYPRGWLYQLSMYALASPARVSVMLYATTSVDAREERVEVRSPGPGGGVFGAVIMSPVLLSRMAELVGPDQDASSAMECRGMARMMVCPKLGSLPTPAPGVRDVEARSAYGLPPQMKADTHG